MALLPPKGMARGQAVRPKGANDVSSNLPAGSSFAVPSPVACNSAYDRFYKNEPGVYAYWSLCDVSPSSPNAADAWGVWGFAYGGNAGGYGPFNTTKGPLPDNETAAQSADGGAHFASQGFIVNKNAGTLAAFVNSDAQSRLVLLAGASAVTDSSGARLQATGSAGNLCFVANLANSAGGATNLRKCKVPLNTWHRLVMTWSNGTLSLYYDGLLVASAPYSGALSDTVFFDQLFPGYPVATQTSLAKVTFANQAWTAAQVAADFAPTFATAPAGGVLVSIEPLGTIHRDVLGYADINQDMSNPANVATYTAALQSMGVTSVRYAGGFGGITADVADWQHGSVQCGDGSNGAAKGTTTMTAQNAATGNSLDNFMSTVAGPAGLDVGYTVNYGTNPPSCNGGGDPVMNGANLVTYANVTKHYGIKHWEIGNEQWSTGCCAIDNHPNPFLKDSTQLSTYPNYEPGFYDAMKAVDPGIEVGVPMNGPEFFAGIMHYGFPCLLHCKYDALVVHPYPVQPDATDGGVLYPERGGAGVVNVEGVLREYQTLLLNAGKPKENLWLTEWDGAPGGAVWNRQSMGAVAPLFVVQQLATFMSLGVPYATYWAQGSESDYCKTFNYDASHAGPNASYNWVSGCGTFSLFRGATPQGGGAQEVGLKPGDILPPGRGFQVLSQSGFVSEGEHMLRVYTDEASAPWLAAWASTHGQSYAVILINRDRDTAHTVPVQLAGKALGVAVQQWSYGRQQYDASAAGDWSRGPIHTTTGAWAGMANVTLPPWSVNVVVF